MTDLFCISPKGEELVGVVDIEPPFQLFLKGCDEEPSKLLLTTYSKNPRHLKRSPDIFSIKLIPVDEDSQRKLLSLGTYLKERGKAGVVPFHGFNFYVQPFDEEDQHCLVCTCPSYAERISSNHDHQKAQQQAKESLQSGNESQSRTESASDAAAVIQPGSILQALSQKMVTTTKIISAPEPPSIVMARTDVVDRMKSVKQALEDKLRLQLQQFDVDPMFSVLRLPPMDKDERYVVHDVVNTHGGLASTAVGDLQDRHVVIYRLGQPPEDIALEAAAAAAASDLRGAHRKQRTDTSYGKPLAPPASQSLIKVNQIKRDRRTTEEIQEEIKRRKQV